MCCAFFDGYPNLGVCAVEMIVARKRGNRGQIFSISRRIVVLFVENFGKYEQILPFSQ